MAQQYETNIHWYPGHMAKTMRLIRAEIKNVDAVCEILDARIPYSSQNPELRKACGRKPRFFILNKADLADEAATKRWLASFRAAGWGAAALTAKQSADKKKLVQALTAFAEENVRSRAAEKPRIMFVGVPNVGKSTVINLLAGQTVAKVENRPGVTRGKQWLTTDTLELLDMPGVLWPKFEDDRCAYNLAYTGAIRDETFDQEAVACSLLAQLAQTQPKAVMQQLALEEDELPEDGYELLEAAARRRGFLQRGGVCDTERAAKAVLSDLRSGKYGRVTLEEPQ